MTYTDSSYVGVTPQEVIPPWMRNISIEDFNAYVEEAFKTTHLVKHIPVYCLEDDRKSAKIYTCSEVISMETSSETPLSYTQILQDNHTLINFDRAIAANEQLDIEYLAPVEKYKMLNETIFMVKPVAKTLINILCKTNIYCEPHNENIKIIK